MTEWVFERDVVVAALQVEISVNVGAAPVGDVDADIVEAPDRLAAG